jgi:peptidoglycan/xylan/chitin deacetylase (PgdA/CDA1 family)
VNGVPVLAFHAVETGPSPLCIDRTTFERQVDELASNGFRSVPLSDVVDSITRGAPIPGRAVAFTFDDAYASVHEHALPVLQRADFRATVFAVTDALGGTNTWDSEPAHRAMRVMAPAALLELRDAGWEIGAHTATHPALPTLDDAAADDEMARADLALADLLGEPVSLFAYPFGLHDERIRRLARARYAACMATGARPATASSDLAAVPRVEAWYLRRPGTLAHLDGRRGRSYLALRRALRAVRRVGR